MGSSRAELEIRGILLSWRDAVRDIRAGRKPESRESIYRATIRALDLLESVQRTYHVFPIAGPADSATRQLADARAEIQGAVRHDLAESGEEAG